MKRKRHGGQMKLFALLISILIGYSAAARAQDGVGDWAVGKADDGETLYAGTVNDSGNIFGEYCTPSLGGCFWLIGLSTACQSSGQYPVLANVDSAATVLTMACSGRLPN